VRFLLEPHALSLDFGVPLVHLYAQCTCCLCLTRICVAEQVLE